MAAAEPSLRSSTQRGNECKLRRTDPALHDTTKRFVESLCPDVRISQYADTVYAAKRMERDPWYWLLPVPGGRVGYLVFQPKLPAVWIDEQFKMSWRIPLRVSTHIYERPTVMIGSLNKTDGLLRLEDCWHISGKSLLETPFTQRWATLTDFYGESYKVDEKLQQGLRVELVELFPLNAVRTWSNYPDTIFAQGERAPRRLRVQTTEKTDSPTKPAAQPKPAKSALVKPMFLEEEEPQAAGEETTPESGQLVAKAVAHEEYPDTYNLWIKGVKKGFAAVQDLDLSRQLRAAAKEAKEIFVNVEWNEEFKMYEILSQK
jgi:hypothetical protein